MTVLLETPGPLQPLDREMAAAGKGRAGRLRVIAGFVRGCLRCDLSTVRRNAIPGEGSATARLMVVGEGPGAVEDREGRPFIGPSGQLLDRMLAGAGIERKRAFITNVVKCRAADLRADRLHNRRPLAYEMEACRPYLERQAAVIRPRVILCLGESAAIGTIGADFRMGSDRGKWFEGPFGSRIIATWHPAYILRKGGAGFSARQIDELVGAELGGVAQVLDG